MRASSITEIIDPGPLRVSGALKTSMGVLAGLGVLGFFLAYSNDPREAFALLLVNYSFYLFLALGGLFFTALSYAANARWSIPMRRLTEGFAAFIPVSFLLLIGIFAGSTHLYEWARETGYPYEGSLKAMYLSLPGFVVRGVLFTGAMTLLYKLIVGSSVRQDTTRDLETKGHNVRRSIIFLIVFALGFTLFSMDLLMSMQSRFYSTMWGIYCFAGMHQSAAAVLVLMLLALRRAGYLDRYVQKFHMYDIGTWVMGFSTFMCYIGFSQFMLIWYANLQDETFWFMQRMEGGWLVILALLPILKWIVPFFLLMPYRARTSPVVLTVVCLSILAGQWLDLYWVVMPTVATDLEPFRLPGLADALLFLGVGGMFGFSLLSFYGKHSLMPVGDPHILPAVNGEYLH
ncbi:MAG: hypothetical protein SF028_12990 [Candidatus Sumerlaeia bacterium]|nr:hypothetical protein [Candidatus Sumerlaeia bacterium]